MTVSPDTIPDAVLFGNRFAAEEVPSAEFPEAGMTAVDAMRLVGEDLALEGDPARNRHFRDHLDGARGAKDHCREPASQLY
jgi:hypothetical protein